MTYNHETSFVLLGIVFALVLIALVLTYLGGGFDD
jgi:hypothetical protein